MFRLPWVQELDIRSLINLMWKIVGARRRGSFICHRLLVLSAITPPRTCRSAGPHGSPSVSAALCRTENEVADLGVQITHRNACGRRFVVRGSCFCSPHPLRTNHSRRTVFRWGLPPASTNSHGRVKSPPQLLEPDSPHRLVRPDSPHELTSGARFTTPTARARFTTPTGGARSTTSTGRSGVSCNVWRTQAVPRNNPISYQLQNISQISAILRCLCSAIGERTAKFKVLPPWLKPPFSRSSTESAQP